MVSDPAWLVTLEGQGVVTQIPITAHSVLSNLLRDWECAWFLRVGRSCSCFIGVV